MLLIFIVINGALFLLNSNSDDQKYILTGDQENQLTAVMEEYGIVMYNFYPNFEPMASYTVSVVEFDREKILSRIFDGMPYSSEKGFGDERVIYERYAYQDQSITFYAGNLSGKIRYVGPSKLYQPKIFEEGEVLAVAMDFSEDLTNSMTDYVVTLSYFDDVQQVYQVLLNEVNEGYPFFCNYVSLVISEDGILAADASLYPKMSMAGSKKEIYPVDEVLYKWMNQIHIKEDELAIIKKIELGYDLGLDELAKDATIEVMPHYRIIMHNGKVYEINAYTNVLRLEVDK